MAWKQDLEKLKQQLGPELPAPARKVAPKPAPGPSGPVPLADEDAVFLSAMGLKPAPPRPPKTSPGEGPAPAPGVPGTQAQDTFQEALKELKGLKPLLKELPEQVPPPAPATPGPQATQSPTPVPVSEVAPPAPVASTVEPLAKPSLPVRFQLAAGMAIEVDGVLDLRGHTLADAMDRLMDRLEDGLILGWRSLLVTLGPNPDLHEGLLKLLASGRAPKVLRYAQAPVPMGGTQAWLLYLGPPPAQP
jgi:hypothetical protein